MITRCSTPLCQAWCFPQKNVPLHPVPSVVLVCQSVSFSFFLSLWTAWTQYLSRFHIRTHAPHGFCAYSCVWVCVCVCVCVCLCVCVWVWVCVCVRVLPSNCRVAVCSFRLSYLCTNESSLFFRSIECHCDCCSRCGVSAQSAPNPQPTIDACVKSTTRRTLHYATVFITTTYTSGSLSMSSVFVKLYRITTHASHDCYC